MARKNTVSAVRTTFSLLEALQELEGAGVTLLADRLHLPKSTVHNHLSTLREDDWVVKDADDQYHLGFRFVDLSHHAKQRVRIYDLVKNEVDKLADESGEMALFTTEEHGIGVCLYRSLGRDAVETPLYVGHRSTLHHTAVGKAILAFLSEKRVYEIIESQGLDQQTADTITDRDVLLTELEEVRETGIAYNHQETIHGLVGVGVPIMNQNGTVAGAISIIGPTSRMGPKQLEDEYPTMIQRSVNVIEINATSI
jgi:DNA-binding IclR family transcriptional regulator